MEVKKGWKMKAAGYTAFFICILITMLLLFKKTELDTANLLLKFWGTMCVTLLFGTAGKQIGGALAASKTEEGK